MKPILATILLLITLASSALAQSDLTGEEEAVLLSPFSISADSDTSYSAASSLIGSRVGTPVVDGLSGNIAPKVPITIVKRADSVVIQFTLSNAADKQETRNQELFTTVQAIQTAVTKTSGLRLEQREVRFASGNRKILSSTRGSQVSYSNIVIFADLAANLRLVDRVKQVRDLLDQVKLQGSTKLLDGSVGLYVKQPSAFRREILQKVFDDLDFVRKGIGSEFEVRPSGLNQQIRMRACSETEVELWIDYSFSIDSIRELVNPKKT